MNEDLLRSLFSTQTSDRDWKKAVSTLPVKKLARIACQSPQNRLALIPHAVGKKKFRVFIARIVKLMHDEDENLAGAAFEVFQFYYQPKTLQYVKCKIFRQSEVDDVVQAFWQQLWARRKTFTPGMDVDRWMATIRKGRVTDAIRKICRDQKKALALHEHYESSDALDEVITLETITAIKEALSHVPPSYQKIIQLRFVEGLSIPEIAAEMGIGASTAKVRLKQAIDRLRGGYV
jgi:RNA polymerase sigma-70 factor, ECF subfamily